MEYTPNHEVYQHILTKGSFVQAGYLKVGDYLCIPKDVPTSERVVPYTEAQAEFLGRMLGDGTYNYKEYRSSHGISHSSAYLACAVSEFQEVQDLLERAELDLPFKREGSVYKFRLTQEVREKFNLLFQYEERDGKSVKYLPEEVLSFDNSQIMAFLKGFHDADGDWSGRRCNFNCIHREILEKVQLLAERVGIYGAIHRYVKRNKKSEKTGFTDRSKTTTIYALTINSACFDKMQHFNKAPKDGYVGTYVKGDEIPCCYPLWREMVLAATVPGSERSNLLKYGRSKPLTREAAQKIYEVPNVKFDKIVSIEEAKSEVFDIEVEDEHAYIGNGVYVHNCTGGASSIDTIYRDNLHVWIPMSENIDEYKLRVVCSKAEMMNAVAGDELTIPNWYQDQAWDEKSIRNYKKYFLWK